jgi:hypothetical protein
MTEKPILIVDGKIINYLNDIKVLYPAPEGVGAEFHMTINHEGLVFDLVNVETGTVEHTQSFEGESFPDYMTDGMLEAEGY